MDTVIPQDVQETVLEAVNAPVAIADGEVVLVAQDGTAEGQAEAEDHAAEVNASGNEEAIAVSEVSADSATPEVA